MRNPASRAARATAEIELHWVGVRLSRGIAMQVVELADRGDPGARHLQETELGNGVEILRSQAAPPPHTWPRASLQEVVLRAEGGTRPRTGRCGARVRPRMARWKGVACAPPPFLEAAHARASGPPARPRSALCWWCRTGRSRGWETLPRACRVVPDARACAASRNGGGAHSHSFQRAIRGRTEHRSAPSEDGSALARRTTSGAGREAMYAAAERLTPEDLHDRFQVLFPGDGAPPGSPRSASSTTLHRDCLGKAVRRPQ